MGMFYNDDGKPKGLFGGIIDFAKSDYATGLAGSLSRGQGLGQAHMFGSGYEKSIKDEKFRKHQQTKLDAFHKEIAQDKAAQAERDSTITNALKIKKLGEEVKKRTFRGVDGKHYYEGGEAVLPGVQAQMPTQPQRRIVKGNDGFNYYGDDGSRVLPDVQAAPKGAGGAGGSGGGRLKFSNEQAKIAGYAERWLKGNGVLEEHLKSRTFFNKPDNRVFDDSFLWEGDEAKAYESIVEEMASVVYRKESGAAVSEKEKADVRGRFFPQSGDGEQTLRLKAENRKKYAELLKKESQGVYAAQYGSGDSGGNTADNLRNKLNNKYGL